VHAGRHVLGLVLNRIGCLHLCKNVEMQLPVIRLPSMTLDSDALRSMEVVEKVDVNNVWFPVHSDKVHYQQHFTYGYVRSTLTNHIARKSALQHLFAEDHGESMGRFADHVMDAFYVAESNTRFQILQIFEDRLFAVYGYGTQSLAGDARVWNRFPYLMPVYTPCECAWKAYVTGLPCRCGASYMCL